VVLVWIALAKQKVRVRVGRNPVRCLSTWTWCTTLS
jgi:hypothetical protein